MTRVPDKATESSAGPDGAVGHKVAAATKDRSDKEQEESSPAVVRSAFMVLEQQRGRTRGGKSVWPRTANRGVQTGGEISGSVTTTVTHLPLSVTEKTSRKPSPVLMYCSLMAPNSSCPAVSRTGECVQSHTSTHIGSSQQRDTTLFLEYNNNNNNDAQSSPINTYWWERFLSDRPQING